MAIILNGGENPTSVYFNGESLDYVCARSGDSGSFDVVWSKYSSFPSTISLVRLYNSIKSQKYAIYEGCFDIYLRDLVFDDVYYVVYEGSDLIERAVVYKTASSSFDLEWRRYAAAGGVYSDGTAYGGPEPRGTKPTITGVPSSLDYDSFEIYPDLSPSLDFKVAPDGHNYPDYDPRVPSLQTIQIDCDIDYILSSGEYRIWGKSTSYRPPTSYGAGTHTATDGLIFQGSATVKFWKRVSSINT